MNGTQKLAGWEPQEKPDEELCKRLRQYILEVVFAVWSEHKKPVAMSPQKPGHFFIARGVQKKIRAAQEKGEWPQEWGHVGKRTIDRRVNEAADPRFYKDGIPKIVAVTAGVYQPNPALFKIIAAGLKTEVTKQLLEDPEIAAKFDAAPTWSDGLKILDEEAEKRGFKITTMKVLGEES